MTGQTVLITGANRGIGLALTEVFLKSGDKVIATCRIPETADELHALSEKYPALTIESLDVTGQGSRKALAAKLADTPIDILINNAGIYSGDGPHIDAVTEDPTQELGTLNEDLWMKVIRTNSLAPIMVTQDLLPSLEKGAAKKVVMVTSEMGSLQNMSRPGDFAYRTSKTILNAATKSIAVHLQMKGFIVIALHPGWTRTRMGSNKAAYMASDSAARIVQTISSLTPKQTATYMNLNGELMAW